MDEKFTHLLTYRELKNCSPDIFSDAFGIEALIENLLSGVTENNSGPDERVISDLFEKIRKDAKVH